MGAPYGWSGFYGGAKGGWGSSRNCWDVVNPAGTLIASDGCHNATGGTAGGQLGFRTQSYSWVFGLEAQGNWVGLGGSQGATDTFIAVPGAIPKRSRCQAS